MSESNFIEDYFIEDGLKQKQSPEPGTAKKHSFMEQYPTKKSDEDAIEGVAKISRIAEGKKDEANQSLKKKLREILQFGDDR